VFKFQHDILTRAPEGTGPLGRAGFRYSSVFSFVRISLVRPQPKARASNLRAQTAPAVLEKINFQITSVPADGSSAAGGKLRHVPRFVGSYLASRCLPVTIPSVVPKSKHKGASKTQFALEVSVVVISRPAGRSSSRPLRLCGSEARRRKYRSGDS
jgi:hypothetical protein